MRVRATDLCYYGDRRQRPGQVFTLKDPKHFNPKCMEKLDKKNTKGAGAQAAAKIEAPPEDDLYPDDEPGDETAATGDQEVI